MNRTMVLLRMCLQAFSLSLGGVAGLTLLVGLCLVPTVDSQIWKGREVSINHCAFGPGCSTAVASVWYADSHFASGHKSELALLALDRATPVLMNHWPQLIPSAVVASADGRRCFASRRDGAIFSFTPSQPAALDFIGQHTGTVPHLLAASADGHWLVSLDRDVLCVWDLHSKELVWQRVNSVRCLALTADSGALVCGLSNGCVVELQLASGSLVRQITRHGTVVWSVAVCGAGQQVASLCMQQTLRICDRQTGLVRWERVARCLHPAMQFSPAGSRLVTVEYMPKDSLSICVWDCTSRDCRAQLTGHKNAVQGLAFQSEDELISWGGDGTIRFWRIGTGVARIVRPGECGWFEHW